MQTANSTEFLKCFRLIGKCQTVKPVAVYDTLKIKGGYFRFKRENLISGSFN